MSKQHKPTKFIDVDEENNRCRVCKEVITKRLDLEKTNAVLCSFKCEQTYWFDILY